MMQIIPTFQNHIAGLSEHQTPLERKEAKNVRAIWHLKYQKPEQNNCRGSTGITHTSAILNYTMSYQVFSGEVKKLV